MEKVNSYAPSNASRLGIRGKDGVAEMAVIDDGEPSVSISANSNIYTTAKAQHHSYSSLFLQMVNGDCNIDILGNENKGIAGDNKQSIGGNQELTVMGSQQQFILGDQTEEIGGNRTITIVGNNKVDCLSDWWKKYFGMTNEIKIGLTHAINFSEALKATFGISNEYKWSTGMTITNGKSVSLNRSHTVELRTDTRTLEIKKDKKDNITGKWTATAGKDISIKTTGGMLLLKSNKGMAISSETGSILQTSQKKMALKSKTSTVEVNGKTGVEIAAGSSKVKITTACVDAKSNLIKFG